MRKVPINSVADVAAGQGAPKPGEFSDEGIPFVRAGSLEYLIAGKNESELELVPIEIAKKRKLKLYPKGSILFAKSGMSATKDRIYVLQNPAYVVSHLAILTPKDNIRREYLRLALKQFSPSNLIKDPAYPSIGLGEIQGHEIPVPEEINDQIRIAHLLGKVEELIAQRKQHLQQLDDLLKSVFLEMFGDPVRNEEGWDKKPFSDLLLNIESGKSPKCEARPASEEEWGVLKLGAITRCEFDVSQNKALPEETAPTVKHEIKAGDLLFSRKNTYELVAACAYVYETRPRLLMPDLIFRFVFKKDAEVNPIYIWKLLTNESQRKAIQSFAAGAAGSMPNISKANLKTAQLPVPPIELQNQFATIVDKVKELKFCYQQSMSDLGSLYGALSQQAFKGELDLSRVPLPNVQVDTEETSLFEQAEIPEAEDISINLTDSDYLLDALTDLSLRKRLLREWLESYCQQMGNAAFSTNNFLAAAQTRIAELHPDSEFELDAGDFEIVKDWVFDALAKGTLAQRFNDENNRIDLNARPRNWGEWS